MELAERIRAIREIRGLTQADVAYELNITPQAYSKMERQAKKEPEWKHFGNWQIFSPSASCFWLTLTIRGYYAL